MRSGSAGSAKSVKDAKASLKNVLSKARVVTTDYLEAVGTDIVVEAYAMTPVDTGKLRNSITSKVERRRGGITLAITASAHDDKTGYDYAYIQHEKTSFHHPRGGRDHYISIPYENAVKDVAKDLADRLGMLF